MKAEAVAIVSADTTFPLLADLMFYEPYCSAAFNRKLKNILLPGFYEGFNPEPGVGLQLVIASPASGGAASVDVNGSQITVQQQADVSLLLTAGHVSIIALEANYQFGVKTAQVDSSSSIQAARIIALVDEDLADNQIELCRVNIPSDASQIDESMIDLSFRVNRGLGIQLSSELDNERDDIAASSHAVKKLHDLINSIEIPIGSTLQAGVVQLSSATDSTSESVAATSKAVKAAYDLANGKYTAQDATTAQKGLVQLSSATDSTSETLAATPKAVKAVNDDLAAVKKTLGSASGTDVVTSTTDTTQGRVPIVGWQGLGAEYGINYDDSNTPNVTCFFRGDAQAIHGPVANAPFNILQFQYDKNAGQQIGYRAGVADAAMYHRSKINGVWGDWLQVFDTLHPPTPAQVGALPSTGGRLTGDLEIYDAAPIVQLTETDTGKRYFIVVDGSEFRIQEDTTSGNRILAYGAASKILSTVGQLVPGDYANFDGRFIKLAGSTNVVGIVRNSSEFQTTSLNSYRHVAGSYGTFWRQDGNNLYLMVTNSGDQFGDYNSLRPFAINLATGYPTMSRLGLSDYTNFDSRYYTKTLSDANFQPKGSYAAPDTSGISGNVLWWKNTATGVITMIGTTASLANSGRVTFPFAFPNKCYGVIPTRNNSTGEGAAMQPYDVNTTGWNLRIAGGGTETVMWIAMGN